MKNLGQTALTVLEQVKQTGQKPQLCAQPNQAVTLHRDTQGKAHLATMLFQCFQTLKLYGKEPEQLEAVITTFNMVLADYPFEKIEQAFSFYLKHHNELPAPADIANIIERGIKPPFDKAVYVSITRKDAQHRTSDEWAYMRDYEKFMISGKH